MRGDQIGVGASKHKILAAFRNANIIFHMNVLLVIKLS